MQVVQVTLEEMAAQAVVVLVGLNQALVTVLLEQLTLVEAVEAVILPLVQGLQEDLV